LVLPLTLLAAAVSVVVRFLRSTGVERVQIKWLLYAVVFIAITYFAAIIASVTKVDAAEPLWLTVLQTVNILAFGLIPITIGIAITRYGLYEIDALISRTLLVGALGVFITVCTSASWSASARSSASSTRRCGCRCSPRALVAVAFQASA